jgi:hypothetical protein
VIERLETDAASRPQRHRTAEGDRERAALRREATMLGLARHPGVVEVAEADEDGSTLITAAPPGASRLLAGAPVSPRLLAAVAQVVADLHGLGLVHGAISPEQVWVAADGRPVLDGWHRAGLAGDVVEGRPCRPADDVAALVDWATASLAPSGAGRGARTGRRTALQTRLAGTDGQRLTARHLARLLEAEPDEAVAGRVALPESVESVASAADRAAADEGQIDPFHRLRPRDDDVGRESRLPHRIVMLSAVTLLAGLLTVGWGTSHLLHPGARPSAPGPVSADASTTTRPAPPLHVVSARNGLLTVDGRRYLLGGADDDVLVAPWGCADQRALLLRRTTGEVYLFDDWARTDHPVAGRVVAQVAPGSTLSARRSGGGCAEALAVPPSGQPRILEVVTS